MKNNNQLKVTKTFDAPCEVVWGAWTTPSEIAQWFAPGIVMEIRELDVQVGGHFRFADPNDKNVGEYTGTYVKVKPLHELAFKVVDYSQSVDGVGVEAGFKVVFEMVDEKTKMTLTSTPPENSYDKTAFDVWSGCFDRLDNLIKCYT